MNYVIYYLSEKFKDTKAGKFFNKNKLWIILSAVVMCIALVFIITMVSKTGYIKAELKYAKEAYAVDDYNAMLSHIDNILEKDADNEAAIKLKFDFCLNNVKEQRDSGEYINSYDALLEALELCPNDEEALKLKEEIRPLCMKQKKQQEDEEARKQAAEETAKQAEKAEKENKKQQEIQNLIDNYVFDGELAVKILIANVGKEGNSYSYAYSQRSNDANGSYYNVALITDLKISDRHCIYKVYENGTVENTGAFKSIEGYTKATNAESARK